MDKWIYDDLWLTIESRVQPEEKISFVIADDLMKGWPKIPFSNLYCDYFRAVQHNLLMLNLQLWWIKRKKQPCEKIVDVRGEV